MKRYLWLPALLAAVVGVASLLVDVQQLNALGVGVFAGPYAAAVGITTWAGRRHSGAAAAVGTGGAAAMAFLSWWEVTHRQTHGFEFDASNGLQFACCCGGNYLLLAFVACAAIALVQSSEPPHLEQPHLAGESRDAAAKGNQDPLLIDVVCEECGGRSSFPATQRGSVQQCPHCSAYLDVEDEN